MNHLYVRYDKQKKVLYLYSKPIKYGNVECYQKEKCNQVELCIWEALNFCYPATTEPHILYHTLRSYSFQRQMICTYSRATSCTENVPNAQTFCIFLRVTALVIHWTDLYASSVLHKSLSSMWASNYVGSEIINHLVDKNVVIHVRYSYRICYSVGIHFLYFVKSNLPNSNH